MTVEERRNKNLHTIAELEEAGNVLLGIKETEGILRMKRGRTVTDYIKVDEFWKPINAYTR